jgi:hypothetical protein
MLSCYSADKPSAPNSNWWMKHVIAINPDGSIQHGEYDAYGRIDGQDMWLYTKGEHGAGDARDPDCYHQACWVAAGRPRTWTGGSENSVDQGHFFDDGDHNPPEPNPGGLNEWRLDLMGKSRDKPKKDKGKKKPKDKRKPKQKAEAPRVPPGVMV